METILVTGAQGFTGRFLIAKLLRDDPSCRIVGIGRSPENKTHFTHSITVGGHRSGAPLPADFPPADESRYRYYSCSLHDQAALNEMARSHRPSVVFHLAAALRDDAPSRLIDTNVVGTINLLNALGVLTGRPRLILASSGSVYGGNGTQRCREDDRCAPTEPYAISKLASEQCVKVLAPALNVRVVVARIFNIGGPGQDERHVCGRFAAQCVSVVSGMSEPQIEVGDLTTTRDFVDVRDVADALALLARFGSSGRTYNVASGVECKIGYVLDKVLDLVGIAGEVDVVKLYTRPHDVPRQCADIGFLTALGYAPRYTIDETLRDVVDYYKGIVRQEAFQAVR